MSFGRSINFRTWTEWCAWGGLVGFSLLLFLLPISNEQRFPILVFLVIVSAYLAITLYYLLPRTHNAPRVIYASLVLDVFIVGALRLWLVEFLPNLDIVFIPLIGIGALVADRRGIVALALYAALADLFGELRLWIGLAGAHYALLFMNQLAIAGGFVIIGLGIFSLVQTVRRRSLESEQAALRVADVERKHREMIERSTRRFQVLNAVGLRVQQEYDMDRIYRVIADELRPLGFDYLIALWDDRKHALRLAYLSLPDSVYDSIVQLNAPRSSDCATDIRDLPLYQQVIVQHRAVFHTSPGDVLRSVFPNLSPDQVTQILQISSAPALILAPLLAGDQVIGFMHLWGSGLESEDCPAMTSLAQQTALALEKARLLKREQKRAAQLELVSEIAARTVGLTDLGQVLEELARLIVQRFGFESASILLNDVPARQVVLRTHHGQLIHRESVGYRQSWDIGLIGAAVRTGTTILCNDVRQDRRYYASQPERDICRSELCVPLKRGDEVLGVLDVQSAALNAFMVDDAEALETLASLTAAVIEKSELFAAERKRAAQLALVSAIAERITAILDPDLLLNQVVELIRERFGYYSVTLFTAEPDKHELVMRAISGGYVDVFPRGYCQAVGVGLIGAAAKEGKTVHVGDVSQDARFYFPLDAHTVTGSEMSVPIKIGQRVLGVLDIQTTHTGAFDAGDLAAMETLANQIAVALENARYYAQTKGEAEVKAALLRELSHRVKNNLTAVVGLLSLGLEDETLSREEILNETLTRVQSMAVAHTLLANSRHARVDLAELARRVIEDGIRQMTLPGQQIPFHMQADAVEISAQQAASLALVLNELVANAIKHGGKASPQLALCIRYDHGQARLEFSNRLSSSDETAAPSTSGVGLHLIRTLVEKDLGGHFTLTSDANTFFSVISFTPQV